MAKAVKATLASLIKIVPNNCVTVNLSSKTKPFGTPTAKYLLSSSTHGISPQLSRTHSTISSLSSIRRSNLSKQCWCASSVSSKPHAAYYSSTVDKEISSFLQKEIQYEVSRAPTDLPQLFGFEIKTEGGEVTLTKTANKEKLVIKLSVNGAVDSVHSPDEKPDSNEEPPQMVCRPPFEVELTKGDGSVLALQCAFPSAEEPFEDAKQTPDEIEDQFEIQEVAFHGGEWKDSTYAVSAATMDAELFDLLMDMLDERGINDEFISQLVDYCTSYENTQYINFLKSLKTFADK